MKRTNLMPLLAFILVIAGCEKDPTEQTPPPPAGSTKPAFLLDSIKYQSPVQAKSVYYYNADSTVKRIDYSAAGSAYSYLFSFVDGNISQHHLNNPMYISRYTYANGRIVKMEELDVIAANRGHKLEYTYNTNGSVSTLKYSTINESGAKLIYTSTYQYDNAGDLHTIESIGNNNSKVVWTIESYSAACDFNPAVFVRTTLDEFYVLYNFPVLNQLKKLPSKITYATTTNSATPVIEEIYETTYTITNKRIDKMVSAVIFVNNPNYNTSTESLFYYRP